MMNLSRPALLVALALGCLVGCAPGQKFVESSDARIASGDIEGGLEELEQAVKAEPDNYRYRVQLVRQKEAYVDGLLAGGDAECTAAHFDEAAALYNKVLAIEPGNPRAHAGLGRIDVERKHLAVLKDAQKLFSTGQADAASAQIRSVLAEDPANPGALALRKQIEDADPHRGVPSGLRAALRREVSLEFRDANIRSVFEALARSTGVNFVFDREVKPDLKVTVYLQKTSVDDAISVLTTTNQLDRKYLNDSTVLIYPNTLAKQKDYQDLAIRTFYLANAEAKSIVTMLKTVLKTRDIYADDKLNSVTVRDTPAAVRLVEKMIAAQDLAEPEVTLEVEVLEVSRTRLTQLGVSPPGQFTLLNIVPSPTQTVAANGTVVTNVNPVTTTSQLTVENLKHFTAGSIGITSPQVNVHAELGDTNLLANPRIRVKNREKAHVLIGDKVPVITTTSTANVGVSESVSYLDVGLKLDVQPLVYLDNEVSINVALEVSSIVKQITTQTGTLTYQIGTRSATTSLRLKDGETQVLAGLINDQERHSAEGLPGLINIPIANRLFSSGTDQHDKTEIVLLITPHVVRNITHSDETLLEYAAGTESQAGASGLVLQSSASITVPPVGEPGARARVRPVPQGAAAEESSAPPAPSATAEGPEARPEPRPEPAPEPSTGPLTDPGARAAQGAPAVEASEMKPAVPASLPEAKSLSISPSPGTNN